MYLAFKHIHLATAVLSLLLAFVWTLAAWRAASAPGGQPGKVRVFYILDQAAAGLAGLSGLLVTLVGPWKLMLFPYIGLVAFIGHGLAAGAAWRTLMSGRKAVPKTALILQNLALLLAAYVMAAKPI
ncbi:hypothetical protein E6C76_13660 [Pseudothauera nasutitermitis]|uniref:Protoporphyrinogen IX oxidase n=1 Tax=Pseudothauera nasutitermitis TaxID=2565930 RepID=A0A4S4AUM6_9RHOO|nr:hypothetical protein [Pseudothauera nasutitermitis]THF63636.1 hypothetical protein E6C76_13660 [Pseudothauera nasutitermitis]